MPNIRLEENLHNGSAAAVPRLTVRYVSIPYDDASPSRSGSDLGWRKPSLRMTRLRWLVRGYLLALLKLQTTPVVVP